MKIRTLLLTAALIAPFAFAPAGLAKNHEPGAQKVTVVFQNWQHFTDIKDRYSPTDSGEQGILNEIQHYIESYAHNDVPDGDHLTMTFTDIDLAGEFEPWHGPSWQDVRMVKDIYPPHLVFTWKLTGPGGEVIKQGSENILDMNYQTRLVIDNSDPLRYEKDILRDWMNRKVK